ncbi:hypothetical protein AWB80_07529 [Caballeronia pedi]|uniref:Uncharacterized protein n=1 Tax=Caballeronia pedi TaxID=1777141 RepID=A0A158DV23_9BURK|nr:hypothetical protein [Caballeronia pedi]SAK98471.1 hypothetical protein AWB80_07529 [Caballeronia pedi]
MYTVKYCINGCPHIERYERPEWRDHRAARLLALGFAITIKKEPK